MKGDFSFDGYKKAVNELISLMEREAECYSFKDMNNLNNIVQKKEYLTKQLGLYNESFEKNKEHIIASLTDDEKLQLREMAQKLHDASEHNVRELEKELMFKKEFATTIHEIVLNNQKDMSGYGKNGKIKSSHSQLNPPAIAINEKL